ncbi:MAG: Mfa1 family fimbria major subunit [Prevotellamassilia sp.]|nr:Mfa1 family fimbria major subunit [Prevotellamassilia sp.]
MKKQFGLPLMLASALAFSACSSDDVAENGPKDIAALTDGGYVKMNIKLPSRSASAFKANDGFNDGLDTEYKVNDATLILFQGDNEATARFHSAYMLSTGFNTDGTTTNQVTSTERLTKSVNGETVGDNLYALVVLNKNNVIAPQANHTLKVNGNDFYGNFAELQKTIVGGNVTAFNKTGFFMTNAPLADKQGGTADPTGAGITTLVKINNAVYSTQTAAENSPAADIYVERGVAKVTMHSKAKTTLTDKVYQDPMNTVSYTIDAWGLDITNNTSYFSRVPSTTWNSLKSDRATSTSYRFIGKTNMENNAVVGATGLFRTYWGVDPNYDADPATGAFNELGANPDADATKDITKLYNEFGDANPLYCMENTFDVANMKQDRSTRVVVRAQLSSADIPAGQDFYTVNGEKATIYSKTTLENMIKKAILDHADVKTFIKNNGGVASAFKVYLSTRTTEGKVTVTGFTLEVGGHAFDDAGKTVVVDAVNNQLKDITCYEKGYAYYPIIIKHFGKDDTPWGLDKDNTITGTTIYPTTGAGADANYLGRYGVLRNNWYDLEVNSIRTIGSAVVPSRDDKYDDELNQFISVKINVLSWAKRTQKEDL